MTKKLTKPLAFLSAVAMLLTMLLYLPSGVFRDIGLGLSANAEEITPIMPYKDENGVYQIGTAAELYWFANHVNGGNYSANAKLTDNITVNEDLLASLEYDAEGNVTNGSDFTKWTPIAEYSSNNLNQYKGTFDGNGKTISGLFFDNSEKNYVGFFGYIDSGKVTDVKISDSYIRGQYNVGGVCGWNYSGEITKCGNSGTVVGTEIVGGVCGTNGNNNETTNDIIDCYNEGTVIATGSWIGGVCGDNYNGCSGCYNTGNVSGSSEVGGVCGNVKGEVINCYNTGDISATGNRIGGVCGNGNSADAKFTNCHNTGNVTSTVEGKTYIGGVCGYLYGEMTDCYNTGKVITTGQQVGGVCGENYGTIENCNNLGEVSGKSYIGGVCGRNYTGEITECSNKGKVVGDSTVGGVCGYNYSNAKDITDSYNEGTVIGTGNYIGGVCGDNYLGCSGCYNTGNVSGDWYVSGVCGSVKGELINCYNTGDISATGNRIGGVCGSTNSADAKITGCYNTGNITSTVDDKFHIGGVCGYFNGEMTDCYNTGKVSTKGNQVGGVCGLNYVTVKNCYNLGNVSGKENIGGVCGYTQSISITVNCYSLGEVSGSSNVGGVCGNNGNAIANCYFNSTAYTGDAIGDDYSQNTVNVSGKAVASFANGEVCYLLLQGHTVGETVYDGSVWGQTLEADEYPVFGGDKVYQNKTYAGCIHKPGDASYDYSNVSKAAVYASFTEVTDEAVEPTCTKTGLTEGSHCSVCGKAIVAQEVVSKTEHTYGYPAIQPATCTEDGWKSVICTVCKGAEKRETIPATGHSYETTVVAPTYAAQGYTLHTCSECGYSYKDTYTAKLTVSNVTGLKMTANTPTSISMSWNKVSGATGYVVYQAINGKWERIKVTSGNTLTVSNLKAGTNYRFTVKAYKTVSGTNYYSPSYTGVWMTTTPAKPAAKMTVNTPQAIRLEWGNVTGATGYVVYQQINGTWVKKATTTNNVYVATGLKSGTNYNFAVRAYRTFNGKNYYSPFATATDTIKTCTKPATVSFTFTAGTKKATVNWSKVTGATGYIVYYKTSANGSWQRLTTTTGTTFTKTGLTTGKTYYFTVKAYKTYNGKTYDASFTTKSVKVK